jgi:septum site-determining protein MinD
MGAALASSGQTVVVVDFDVGLRNLDLVMGAERRVVYDLINVIQGHAKLPQALIRDKRVDTLSLLPASQTRDKDSLTEEGVARVMRELRAKFNWVICDSPAGIERGATLAMRFADTAIIVTNPEVSSVRDADRIIGLLDSKTEKAEKGRARRKAHPHHTIRRSSGSARRDAQHQRCARHPVATPSRDHSGERGSVACVQRRLADYTQRPDERTGSRLPRRCAKA